MTAVQPPLWREGWERESCGEADPVLPLGERRRSPWRIHNGPLFDHGRSAARADVAVGRRVHTIVVAGEVL